MSTPTPAPRPKETFYHKHESTILGWASVLLFLGIWQAMWSAGQISPLFMSGPSAIAKRFWEDLQHGTLLAVPKHIRRGKLEGDRVEVSLKPR